MRATLALAAVVATAAATAGGALAAPRLVVTLAAGPHRPHVGVDWPYTVRATRAGRPVAGRITVQIVDPIGTAHPVTYRNTRRPVVRFRFPGLFRDSVVWPASSRGVPLTLRVTVTAGADRSVASYPVTPVR